ncbi:hypothetical protein [Stomatohabitans albus]|uniref:hypothetical protein n=1 Tax=Stomatohabitans albus TaxID=3110766 RepID=UPI00300D40E8
MSILRLTREALSFLYAYGIVAIYIVITGFYVVILLLLDEGIRAPIATFIIFSDPAAMGMAFMGAVMLLEKNQRVSLTLVTSPLPLWKYIVAQVLTFLLMGSGVALVLLLVTHDRSVVITIFGVAITSIGFSLLGMLIGASATTLNGYIVQTIIPVLILSIPAFLYLSGLITHPWWLLHPGVSAIALISGRMDWVTLVVVIGWTIPLLHITHTAVRRSFTQLNEVKV